MPLDITVTFSGRNLDRLKAIAQKQGPRLQAAKADECRTSRLSICWCHNEPRPYRLNCWWLTATLMVYCN